MSDGFRFLVLLLELPVALLVIVPISGCFFSLPADENGAELNEPYTLCVIGLECMASLTMSLISDSADEVADATDGMLAADCTLLADADLKLTNESDGLGSGTVMGCDLTALPERINRKMF